VSTLAVQLIWVQVTQPAARRPALLASVVAAIGYLPWLPTLIKTSQSPGTKLYAFLEPFSLHAIRIDLGRWSIGHPYVPLRVIPGLVAATLALVGLALRTRNSPDGGRLPGPSRGVMLVFVLACAAPAGDAAYSTLRDSVWFARNLISSWSAFGLLAGTLVTRTKPGWRLAATGPADRRGYCRRVQHGSSVHAPP
jgi:hypothetical protein